MNFVGEQAISRTTRNTGRTVLLVSAFSLAVAKGWVDVSEPTFAGIIFREDAFEAVLLIALAFSILAHLVQWFGDLMSFRGWNVAGRKIIGLQYIDDTESRTKLDAFGRNLERILKECEALDQGNHSQKETLYQARDAIPNVARELPTFVKSVRNFGAYAFFYVYFWHLALPLAIAVIAFVGLNYA